MGFDGPYEILYQVISSSQIIKRVIVVFLYLCSAASTRF